MKTGKILSEVMDMNKSMGLAYERSIGFEKEVHSHDRHMIVCPRGSCTMEVNQQKVDSTQVLWVPKGILHNDIGTSTIYDTMAIYPDDKFFSEMIQENGLNVDDETMLCEEIIVLKRTKWLDDILNRYFFERVLNKFSPAGCTFFLEKQIINEVARIIFQDKLNQIWGEKTLDGSGNDPLDIAIRFIEAHLLNTITLEQICEASKMSESTLLRKFKERIGRTPYEYIKSRRLEEAMLLLKKAGSWNIPFRSSLCKQACHFS